MSKTVTIPLDEYLDMVNELEKIKSGMPYVNYTEDYYYSLITENQLSDRLQEITDRLKKEIEIIKEEKERLEKLSKKRGFIPWLT